MICEGLATYLRLRFRAQACLTRFVSPDFIQTSVSLSEWLRRQKGVPLGGGIGSRLFVLLSRAHGAMLFMLILSDSFLDCLPRSGRILPRRILTRASTISHFVRVKREGEQDVAKKMAIGRVFLVSIELRSIVELAFGNCGKYQGNAKPAPSGKAQQNGSEIR